MVKVNESIKEVKKKVLAFLFFISCLGEIPRSSTATLIPSKIKKYPAAVADKQLTNAVTRLLRLGFFILLLLLFFPGSLEMVFGEEQPLFSPEPWSYRWSQLSLKNDYVEVQFQKDIVSNYSLLPLLSVIKAEKNTVQVDTALFPELNQPAVITFRNTGFTGKVLALNNGRLEKEVIPKPLNGTDYQIEADHWSTWSLVPAKERKAPEKILVFGSRDGDTSIQQYDRGLAPQNSLRQYDYWVNQSNLLIFFKDKAASSQAISFEVEHGGKTRNINYQFLGANPNKAIVDGNSITYPELFTDTNLTYFVYPSELKEVFTLYSNRSPANFSFKIQFQGVYYEQYPDYSINFFDEESSQRLWTLTAPKAYDSSENRSREVKSRSVIRNQGINYFLDVVLEEDLNQFTFPIYLDPTIQSACGTLSTTGETYELDQSLTTTTDCLVVGANDITINGVGQNLTGDNGTVDYGIDNSGGYNNLTVLNFRYINQFGRGIDLEGSNFSTITNNTIRPAVASILYGIYLKGVNHSFITNNVINTTGTAGAGIYLFSSSFYNNVTGNWVSANASDDGIALSTYSIFNNITLNYVDIGGVGEGIDLVTSSNYNFVYLNTISTVGSNAPGISITSSSNGSIILNNTVNTSSSSSHGIFLFSNVRDNNITSNKVGTVGTGANGIHLITRVTNNTVVDNTISQRNTGEGILVASDAKENLIKDNLISTAVGSASYGIHLWTRASNNVVVGNTINTSGTTGHGVYIFPDGHYNNISSNFITVTGSGSGIYIYDNSSFNNVSGNFITSTSTGDGIVINRLSENNILNSNEINTSGSSAGGIYLTAGAGNNYVLNNRINTTGSSAYGIYLSHSRLNNITSNTIRTTGLTGTGIYLDINASSNTITDNYITTLSTATTLALGITLEDGSQNNTISSNYINTTSINGYGIYLLRGANSTWIDRNEIITTGAGTPAIYMVASFNNTLLNNNLTVKRGLYLIRDDTPEADWSGNFLIYNNSFGEIKWPDNGTGAFTRNLTLNATNVNGIGLGKNLFIGNNTLAVNTSAFQIGKINSSVNLSLFGLNLTSADLVLFLHNYTEDEVFLRDQGADCLGGICTKISYAGNTLLFNSTSLGSFRAADAAVSDTNYPVFSNYWDNNGTLAGSGLGSFNVTVNNTNGTVYLNINGASILAGNITFSIYNASYQFSSAGTYLYNWTSYGNGSSKNANTSINLYYTVNSTGNNLPTAPTLNLTPANGSHITNRTPIFIWSNSTDADGDAISYHLQVDDNAIFNNPEINVSSLPPDAGKPNTTYYSSVELNVDTAYYWRVRANDSTGYGAWSNAEALNLSNFTVDSLLSITFTNGRMEFGSLEPGSMNDTTDGLPPPFRAENTGNIFFNVSVNASQLLATVELNNSNYQFKIRANESSSFDTALSTTSWRNLSKNLHAVDNVVELNWRTINNDFLMDVNVSIPTDESPGAKSSNVTFTVTGSSVS